MQHEPVDNVEQLWLPQLPPGRYDLQVLKNGGTDVISANGRPMPSHLNFISPTLNVARSGTNAVLAWPVYPAGFVVEADDQS